MSAGKEKIMAEIVIPVAVADWVWREFADYARRRRRKPESLAQEICRDAIQRIIDEDLDAATRRDAQRTKFREEDTEEIIREWRRKKALNAANGPAKKRTPVG